MRRFIFFLFLIFPNVLPAQNIMSELLNRNIYTTFSIMAYGTTPEQRLFDWTTLQFDKLVYAQRRAKFVQTLKNSGSGIFLAPSSHARVPLTKLKRDLVWHEPSMHVPHQKGCISCVNVMTRAPARLCSVGCVVRLRNEPKFSSS